MCWITFKQPIRRKAPRDIPIYKILRPVFPLGRNDTSRNILDQVITFMSPCANTLYELNKKKTSCLQKATLYKNKEDGFTNPPHSFVNEGLHSFQKSKLRHEITNVGTYFNGLYHQKFFISIHRNWLCEGYIPRGAEYYLNERGEYVSSELVITNRVRLGEIYIKLKEHPNPTGSKHWIR